MSRRWAVEWRRPGGTWSVYVVWDEPNAKRWAEEAAKYIHLDREFRVVPYVSEGESDGD